HCTAPVAGLGEGVGELEGLGDERGDEWLTLLLAPPTWRGVAVLCRPALLLYWFRLSVAGAAASSAIAARARTWWVTVALGAELNARSLICGTAARAPSAGPCCGSSSYRCTDCHTSGQTCGANPNTCPTTDPRPVTQHLLRFSPGLTQLQSGSMPGHLGPCRGFRLND